MVNIKGLRYAVFLLIIGLTLAIGCVDKKSKVSLFGKRKVCSGLWLEKYRVFSGGAYSAELYTDYLTDSTNFRVLIGQHDDMSNFSYDCKGDTVVVTKFLIEENGRKRPDKESNFSLSHLKSQGIFE
ncbi:MAG: hypothetical protein ABWZ25_16815 [Chitinophagaceae bacterium]